MPRHLLPAGWPLTWPLRWQRWTARASAGWRWPPKRLRRAGERRRRRSVGEGGGGLHLHEAATVAVCADAPRPCQPCCSRRACRKSLHLTLVACIHVLLAQLLFDVRAALARLHALLALGGGVAAGEEEVYDGLHRLLEVCAFSFASFALPMLRAARTSVDALTRKRALRSAGRPRPARVAACVLQSQRQSSVAAASALVLSARLPCRLHASP